jgi:hypothetical protein
MRNLARSLLARAAGLCTALAAGAVVAAGCVHHHHHGGPAPGAYPGPPPGKPGPPPHAPAHGYRRKNPDGIEVVFDVGVGVYVVLGHDGIYWDGGRYLRWRDTGWWVSARVDGGWVSVGFDDVPEPLRARHGRPGSKAKKPGHGRGHGPPAKRAD